LNLNAAVSSVFHRVAPGDTFNLPGGFIGLFQGNWDEAGYRTQRFVEAVLAKPAPAHFPYVSWDSWGYNAAIDEQTLRQNAQIAATMGIELFVVDLGWARALGDWREDPQKFPSGLAALSDYVHSLGMKFGLHFAFVEAMAESPVLKEHPDWTASVSDNYFGALSLCLSHQPVRNWVTQQALAIIDNYNVDYLLQDAQNMVKKCTRTTHTHDRRDSNYSNAVDGLDAIVEEVQRQRPNVLWEN
jgi:alpha-galactosidase